jgi:exosortase A
MHPGSHLSHVLAAPGQRGRPAVAAIIVFLLFWTLAVFGVTTASMIAIWKRSETFAHGYLVVPLFLYLLWREREAIAALVPKPFLPALLGIVALGLVWWIAVQLRVNSIAQIAVIGMIPIAIWTVLGTVAIRLLGFPLFFLFFAVPIGEFLMPTLMEWTADVTVTALRASGVPVYREDNHFTIPTGRWSVIEACSGLRYLIASFMVGCLFAYLSFRSIRRRSMFILASILVPIVANWIRAYAIVMLGHLSGNRIAAGADHLIYGWIFFGVVMAILFAFGSRWREDIGEEQRGRVKPPAPLGFPAESPRIHGAVLGVLLATAIWPVLDFATDHDLPGSASRTLHPVPGNGGWVVAGAPLSNWVPDVAGATAVFSQTYQKEGTRVGLFIAYFDGRVRQAKAITSTNQLVSTTNRNWMLVGRGVTTADLGNTKVTVRTGLLAGEGQRLAAWQWYWVDGRTTSSDLAAKAYEALALARARPSSAAWVVLYTPAEGRDEQIRERLESFARAMGSDIDKALFAAAEP